jgi:hypothetical protein
MLYCWIQALYLANEDISTENMHAVFGLQMFVKKAAGLEWDSVGLWDSCGMALKRDSLVWY